MRANKPIEFKPCRICGKDSIFPKLQLCDQHYYEYRRAITAKNLPKKPYKRSTFSNHQIDIREHHQKMIRKYFGGYKGNQLTKI